jgi:hypothetical protein
MRATGATSTFVLRAPKTLTDATWNAAIKDVRSTNNHIIKLWQTRVRNGSISADDASIVHNDELTSRMAKKWGLEYEIIPVKP